MNLYHSYLIDFRTRGNDVLDRNLWYNSYPYLLTEVGAGGNNYFEYYRDLYGDDNIPVHRHAFGLGLVLEWILPITDRLDLKQAFSIGAYNEPSVVYDEVWQAGVTLGSRTNYYSHLSIGVIYNLN